MSVEKVAPRLTKRHASVVFLHGSQGSFLCFVAIASLDCVEIFVKLIHVYTYVIYEMKNNYFGLLKIQVKF